jgi:hypothetical protein
MSVYRVWQIKRDGQVTGPFPENLIVQHVLLGRIVADDLISMDGHAWKSYRETPEIIEQISHMMGGEVASTADPAWHDERLRAVLRYVDERKHLDPRSQEAQDAAEKFIMRSGIDRRKVPETVEQHSHRVTIAESDQWFKDRHPGKNIVAVALLFIVVLVAWSFQRFGSKDVPVDIGLHVASCDAEPVNKVDWHGCDKTGYFLVGADLREANLKDVRFPGANLSYANFKGARLDDAVLDNAKLAGATWVDGRVCADDSVGVCR